MRGLYYRANSFSLSYFPSLFLPRSFLLTLAHQRKSSRFLASSFTPADGSYLWREKHVHIRFYVCTNIAVHANSYDLATDTELLFHQNSSQHRIKNSIWFWLRDHVVFVFVVVAVEKEKIECLHGVELGRVDEGGSTRSRSKARWVPDTSEVSVVLLFLVKMHFQNAQPWRNNSVKRNT